MSQTLLNQKDSVAAYIANIDPAVDFLPYTPNTDIRKTIDIKKLMQ